jgi:hypothetical protein
MKTELNVGPELSVHTRLPLNIPDLSYKFDAEIAFEPLRCPLPVSACDPVSIFVPVRTSDCVGSPDKLMSCDWDITKLPVGALV